MLLNEQGSYQNHDPSYETKQTHVQTAGGWKEIDHNANSCDLWKGSSAGYPRFSSKFFSAFSKFRAMINYFYNGD